MAFSVTATQVGKEIVIALNGHLDETADLSQIKFNSGERVILDAQNLKLISSEGVRKWILFSKSAGIPHGLVIRNVPQIFVNLLNMVVESLPRHVVIESFYIPYVCPECLANEDILLKKGSHFQLGSIAVQLPQAPKCRSCGLEMEVDVLIPAYFEFLKSIGP